MQQSDTLLYVQEHIALGTGWKVMYAQDMKYWTDPQGRYCGGGTYNPLPNYCGSLDAINETVLSLPPTQFGAWKRELLNICAEHGVDPYVASARNRALALYRILP